MPGLHVAVVEVSSFVVYMGRYDFGGEVGVAREATALGAVGFEFTYRDTEGDAILAIGADGFVDHSTCAAPAVFEKVFPDDGVESGYGESAIARDLAFEVGAGVRGHGGEGVHDLR